MEDIHISGPSITKKEINYVKDAAKNAWYGDAYLYHDKFEASFSDYLDVEYAMALPSCTSAIHLALYGLGVGPGDEVIVPDATWIGSSAPISYVGATPVFADIERDSWCLSPEAFEENITADTKAVIPVDLYGNMPEMDRILSIARDHEVFVIEDAAEAHGSEYDGQKAGSFGDAGVFSFHGSKTLVTGEGGLLATDDENVYERALMMRSHGRKPDEDRMFWPSEVGNKYQISSMQAALGLAQLERIDELADRKRQIFEWYETELGDADWITLNSEGPAVKNTYWMVTGILDADLGFRKEGIIDGMAQKEVHCRPFFYPLSEIPAYQSTAAAEKARDLNTVTYDITPYGINFPSGMDMTKEKVKYVVDSLETILDVNG